MARGWTAVLFLATTMTAACGDVSSGGAPDGPDAQTSQDVDGGVVTSVGDGGVNDGATPAEPIGPSSGTLYEPNPATNPDDMVSYPHAILLQQAGALHGTILATFERQVQTAGDPTRGWLIYRSIDSGRSFERLGVPVVPAHFASTSNVLQPNLLELAHAAGKTAAGTLLLSGVAGAGPKLEAQVFQSTDGGASFQFLSVIEAGDTAVSAERPWEPFLIQLDDGSIVAYWSDELVPGGRQNIARKISHDGGLTWGPKAFVWQSAVDSDRPGMVSIARMGDGRYIMAVEMCGAPGDYCRAHVKTSTDGLVWGAGPADMGVRPLSPSGHPFHGNPFVAWTPRGGPKGTVILSARDLLKSVATPNDFAGGRTQTLFVSHDEGDGAWYELTAPIAWQQGATYTQAGYRNALLPLPGSDYLLYFATSYTGAGVRNRIQFATANEGVLPYADPFATNQALGWQTFGGAWTVAGGVYSVTTSGAGDKSIAGSTGWTDVVVDTDLRVDGTGNAGLLIRERNPEVGVDAYDGYYVGLSSADGTAFIGRANGAWTLLGSEHAVAGGIAKGAWMHVTAKAAGCSFSVTVSAVGAAPAVSFTENDPGCSPFGGVGLRAFQTPASWRHFRVNASP